ncbi:unnamed protein product, partial [Diabrotica balteata]
ELLEQLFKLFDQDRDQCLAQEDWIEFLKQRLINETQIDFAEQLESVAYCLCGEKPIYLEQFYLIFLTKGIVDKLFRLIDEENSGVISSEAIMEFLSTVTSTRSRSGFDKGSIDRLEQLFRQTVGEGKEIKKDDFKKIVVSKNPFFTDRVFQIFDNDNSGSISLQEFLDAMHQFAGQTPDDKIRFLFKVYDLDGDGLIQLRELQHVMRACMEENGMQFSEEQVADLTLAMFEDADSNHRGAITYEALKNQLEKHGGLLENLSISIDRWLVPPKPLKRTPVMKKIINWRPYYLTIPYLKNNYVYLAFLLGFLLVNAALFISRAIQYAGSNWYTIFARACVGQWTNRLYGYFEKEQEKLHNGEIPPSTPAAPVKRLSNGSITNNNQNPLKKLHATVARTLSNQNKKPAIQLVGFTNGSFQNEQTPKDPKCETETNFRAACSTADLPNSRPRKLSPENRLHRFLFTNKAPLEKSLSMPDMQTKAKRRERLMVLREYMRSESEKSFNECQIRRARLQSLGLAYLSPQNKSLAQSFRYMRNKPTIIAFKTPSLEDCEKKNSTTSLRQMVRQISQKSFTFSPERQVEEGQVGLTFTDATFSPNLVSLRPMNYPVGKPLEVSIFILIKS